MAIVRIPPPPSTRDFQQAGHQPDTKGGFNHPLPDFCQSQVSRNRMVRRSRLMSAGRWRGLWIESRARQKAHMRKKRYEKCKHDGSKAKIK